MLISSDGFGGLGVTLSGGLGRWLCSEEIFGSLSLERHSRESSEPCRGGSGSGS